MARRKRRGFAGTKAQHRADAGSFVKEARRFATLARKAAARGHCGTAIHLFGVAAFNAGKAVGNRKWVGGKRGKLHAGGSRLGGQIHNLQTRVLSSCKIAR